jgi:hypothetical protein
MNKLAVAIIIGLGLTVYIPGHAADSAKPTAANSATSTSSSSTPATSTAGTSTSATTPAAEGTGAGTSASANAGADASKTGDPTATPGKGKHHKKVAHKHKKDELIGDGEPLSRLGTHKDVDGGFDFDNSKKFVK